MGERGGPAGNLYVVLYVEPHPVFQRRGDDILIELQINIAQATLGANVQVPTLEGEEEISIPAGTQSGTALRLRGKGVPHLRHNGRGDELVLVRIAVPTKLTREQKRLFQELGETLDPESIWQEKDKQLLYKLIQDHLKWTQSKRAKDILDAWPDMLGKFVKVIPIDYRKALEKMKAAEQRDTETTPATEEVFTWAR